MRLVVRAAKQGHRTASMREHFRRNAGRYVTGLIAALLVVAGFLVWYFWDWLRLVSGAQESGTATVRNLGLLVTAIIALPLAIWRSIIADRQAETARRQSETAERGLLNERYQKGAEMLGSKVLTVRLGGIYALARLARERPEEYHTQVMQLFCTFVRLPPEGDEKSTAADGHQQTTRLRVDIQEILTAIGKRSEGQLAVEGDKSKAPYILDLSYTNLAHAQLADAVLSRANLFGAKLSGATLFGAKLSGSVLSQAELVKANLTGADLSHAHLNDTKLTNAILTRADLTSAWLDNADLSYSNLTRAVLTDANLILTNLTHTNLSGCRGLTQEQLNDAVADEVGPPKLMEVVDAKTGERLIWHGKQT